jgi:hypothetical protein
MIERLARRVAWLNSLAPTPSSFSDRLEPDRLMAEANGCFVHGYFMAVVLLATSFAEHAAPLRPYGPDAANNHRPVDLTFYALTWEARAGRRPQRSR